MSATKVVVLLLVGAAMAAKGHRDLWEGAQLRKRGTSLVTVSTPVLDLLGRVYLIAGAVLVVATLLVWSTS